MTNRLPSPTAFYGKRWILIAQVVVFGSLALFSLLMGPLFLLGVITPANGESGTPAGIALTTISLFLLAFLTLPVSHLIALRRPLIGIHQDCLEVRLIGTSSLDHVPFVPGLVRVIWSIVSRQGLRELALLALWESIQSVDTDGPSLYRPKTLIIVGTFISVESEKQKRKGTTVIFSQTDLRDPLDEIAQAIRFYQTEEARLGLSPIQVNEQ